MSLKSPHGEMTIKFVLYCKLLKEHHSEFSDSASNVALGKIFVTESSCPKCEQNLSWVYNL